MKTRTVGSPAKIGIRPAIDGRLGGVRESLEGVTLAQARRTAELIETELRHASGAKVECVVPDHCIGGVREAASVQELFAQHNVGATLTVTPCWCYGSETMDMDPLRPKAIWGFNGTERPGAVYLAATLAGHTQKGLPCFGIYGRDVQDSGDSAIPDDVEEKILRFARAALAVAEMRGKSYLSMGGVSMGIAGSMVEPSLFEKYLGMRVQFADMSEFTRRFEKKIFDEEEYSRALAWVRAMCPEGQDYNDAANQQTRQEKDRAWELSVQMALIARDLMVGNDQLAAKGWGEEALGHNAIAAGFQGQRQWTDHFPNGDFMEAILNSSFDWNGIRQPYILATENDALNGVTMLLGHLLTGAAQIFADLRTYWSPAAVKRVTGYDLEGVAAEGILHCINSGPAALDGNAAAERAGKPAILPHYAMTEEDAERCLRATTWHAGMVEYFRGGGWSTRYCTRGGVPMTMARINLVDRLGPAMQLAEGWTIELPGAIHKILDHRTNPTWPTTWFVPRTGAGVFRNVYTVMNNWGANHCSLCPGHVGSDFITLASMLRIPVYMHNIAEENIFRPSAWTAYGTANLEGADFRACNTYGPLYG